VTDKTVTAFLKTFLFLPTSPICIFNFEQWEFYFKNYATTVKKLNQKNIKRLIYDHLDRDFLLLFQGFSFLIGDSLVYSRVITWNWASFGEFYIFNKEIISLHKDHL